MGRGEVVYDQMRRVVRMGWDGLVLDVVCGVESSGVEPSGVEPKEPSQT